MLQTLAPPSTRVLSSQGVPWLSSHLPSPRRPPDRRVVMADDRRIRILSQLTGPTTGLGTKKLCEVCLDVTEMTGAGIMLMSGETPSGSVCTTNGVSALIEDLQYSL